MLLSFKARFVDLILSGDKTQTIRNPRKIEPGTKLTLCNGIRTKNYNRIGNSVCVSVSPITITQREIHITTDSKIEIVQYSDNFAKLDGFQSFDEMIEFFIIMYGDCFPFTGILIKWKYPLT